MSKQAVECQVCLVVSDVDTTDESVKCPECGTIYSLVTSEDKEDFLRDK